MKKIFFVLTPIIFLTTMLVPLFHPAPVSAATTSNDPSGMFPGFYGALSASIVGVNVPAGTTSNDSFIQQVTNPVTSLYPYLYRPKIEPNGQVYSPGLLGIQGQFVAMLFENQISGQEYVADLMNNIGIPTATRAYAQGTGYTAMSPFLPFWKVFRNLAYSLYIIMFVVVGVMIMLRTKVNAQTIISIQSALPNLLITLILITFSYAIVGFMIDLMYFLIYLAVYLFSAAGIISDPAKLITRFMTYSAWSVIFAGRNSIISAVASSIGSVLWGLGTGAIGVAGAVLSMVSPMYLIVAVAFAIAMLKLMFALVKAYVMLIVQTITAPLQILMNAMPGSKAFSTWLKTTASYLIPFPVAACMFIFSAILVGNPSDKTIWGRILTAVDPNAINTTLQDDNPFGVNQAAPLYATSKSGNLWLPPFTLTDTNIAGSDILVLIGFFVFLMTPSAVKMAQEWLQVKESPYASEALTGFVGLGQTAIGYPMGYVKQAQQMHEQKKVQDYAAGRYAAKMEEYRQKEAAKKTDNPV
jgi:hypothetical protein